MSVLMIEVLKQNLYPDFVQAILNNLVFQEDKTRVDEQATLSLFRQAIIRQDQSAWRIIWKEFQPGISRKIRRELAGWNIDQEEIRDLTQSVFIKFWQDTSRWTHVDQLFTEHKQEGVLSRLHSTAIYTVQRYRQKTIRRWIPLIRSSYTMCSEENRQELQSLANSGLSAKYRDIFLLHLKECRNDFIAKLMKIELKQVSIQINRAWERYVYVLLTHRRQAPEFEPLFQFLISDKPGETQ